MRPQAAFEIHHLSFVIALAENLRPVIGTLSKPSAYVPDHLTPKPMSLLALARAL
jgi:hypothetical protein